MTEIQKRPRDIFDSDLSIHFWDLDNLLDKFLENLTLEEARFFIRTVISTGEMYNNPFGGTIKNYYRFIYRLNWYMSQLNQKSESFKEFIKKYKEFHKNEIQSI